MKKYIFTFLLFNGLIVILSVPRIITYQKTEAPAANHNPESRILTAQVTQYTLRGVMTSGLAVYDGSIACPRSIPLKTKVEIDGIEYICEDRLSEQYDAKFDIWQQDLFSAIQWGIREKEIIIK
jgi:3D (Asp-Asp-Asp) domain-containing protein